MLWNGECEELGNAGKSGSLKVLVMDMLGESLSDLFYSNGKKFSLKTVCMLAIQMIERLEIVHKYGIIHRDIKPGNFVMGLGEDLSVVSLLDFGLCSYFIQKENGKHVKYNSNANFRGTHRYASINAHKKIEQSRRDDIEALAYVLIYFMKGELPWQNLRVKRKERREKVGKLKEKIAILELTCDLNSVFKKFLYYSRQLDFYQEPDYEYLKNMWRRCLKNNNFEEDYVYDWSVSSDSITTPSDSSSNLSALEANLPGRGVKRKIGQTESGRKKRRVS
eukprot:TRINITY_DN1875_c1_g1_i2.p1 TRINITY_DN1875_c1_g1~~TRINITY_DN1875_c1_g1_i2.p1  ORF type:complete len:278 (-),score=58.68 TRINITY_DN1875_c1_g1_i2:130-963(-)